MKYQLILILFIFISYALASEEVAYKPLGVGGGGAMTGITLSPYSTSWFIGTDMGTLFKSTDLGESWNAFSQKEVVFDSNLQRAVAPGVSADGKTLFHASGGLNPKRSEDNGKTFSELNSLGLVPNEFIVYWHPDSSNPNRMLAVTNQGILITSDKGKTWIRSKGINGEPTGTFIDHQTQQIYHANKQSIFLSKDNGQSFTIFYTPSKLKIRQFTGGRDAYGLTLAFADDNGMNACAWADKYSSRLGRDIVSQTKSVCGFVWINETGTFIRSNQFVGDHLKMAENNSSVLYATGARSWLNQSGTRVYVTKDKGDNWNLVLNQVDYDTTPFTYWPANRIEYSAIALDVGWWDNGYESFTVNLRNAAEVAGSGHFFMYSSRNYGENWKAPFTKFLGTGTPQERGEWKTRGLEVISAYKVKFHPNNSKLMYVASADIGGLCSQNHGESFRICKAQYNSNYDYAFDLSNDQIVYAASGNLHDYPNEWRANIITNEGGIYKSMDRGINWTRLTPQTPNFKRQYLSVAYDSKNKILYGGSQENGISRSTDGGSTWSLFNNGLPTKSSKIIPQIEIDPKTGNVYALLAGNAPFYTNYFLTGIYFLDVAKGATKWRLIRGNVNYPKEAPAGNKLWYYPSAFAVDLSSGPGNETIYLTDYENQKNYLMTGIWKSTDGGKNWDRVLQMTHPTQINLDPKNGQKIFAAGYYQLDGKWGNGGQIYSLDGGKSWSKNTSIPLLRNARGVTIDPNNSQNLFYTFFGGGILTGPTPR